MRIPFKFGDSPLEAAYVFAVLDSRKLKIYTRIKFLLDTGATKTVISDKDARAIGVDYGQLQKLGCGMVGIGGEVDTYMLADSRLIFRTESNEEHVVELESICFLKHSEDNESVVNVPSLLGRDIINKYLLVYDKRNDKAYLTDEKNF